MTWTRLDNGFADDPRVLRAGTRALGLYIVALVWANRHGTNGTIPRAALRRLTDEARPVTIAKRLVDSGLWIETGEGYAISEFASHQAHEGDAEGAP